jgi:hypothetical protein
MYRVKQTILTIIMLTLPENSSNVTIPGIAKRISGVQVSTKESVKVQRIRIRGHQERDPYRDPGLKGTVSRKS